MSDTQYPDVIPDHGWPRLFARRLDALDGMQRGIVDEQMRQRSLLEELDRGQKELIGLVGGLLAADSHRARQDTLHDERLQEHDRLLTLRSLLIATGAAVGGGLAQTLWNIIRGLH